jgi:hypothetical protein
VAVLGIVASLKFKLFKLAGNFFTSSQAVPIFIVSSQRMPTTRFSIFGDLKSHQKF